MNNILKSALIMAGVAFAASFALSHINELTEPQIKKQEMEKQQKALSEVLPGYTVKEDKVINASSGSVTIWTAEKTDGEKSEPGYAFTSEKAGYSGKVKVMTGVDKDFNILGISILQQSETPGLGARSTEISGSGTLYELLSGSGNSDSTEKKPWFQQQFGGLTLNKQIEILKKGDWSETISDELHEKNAISAITGATITSKAVRNSIESGFIVLKEYIQSQNGNAGNGEAVK